MSLPFNEVQALSNLLSQSEQARVAQEEGEARNPKPKPKKVESEEEAKERKEREKIAQELEDLKKDGRIIPRHEFIYKQTVGPEDVYFQMSGRDPSTFCCDDMVMRIFMPGTEAMHDLQLDVQPLYLKIQSPIYCLGMFLPYKVDPKCSKAHWDYGSMTLHVAMRIVRGEEDGPD